MSFVPHGNDTLSLPVSMIFKRLSSEAYKYRVKSLSVLIAYCFFSWARIASRPAVAMASFSVSLASRAVGASSEVDESVGELMPSSQSMETPSATAIR